MFLFLCPPSQSLLRYFPYSPYVMSSSDSRVLWRTRGGKRFVAERGQFDPFSVGPDHPCGICHTSTTTHICIGEHCRGGDLCELSDDDHNRTTDSTTTTTAANESPLKHNPFSSSSNPEEMSWAPSTSLRNLNLNLPTSQAVVSEIMSSNVRRILQKLRIEERLVGEQDFTQRLALESKYSSRLNERMNTVCASSIILRPSKNLIGAVSLALEVNESKFRTALAAQLDRWNWSWSSQTLSEVELMRLIWEVDAPLHPENEPMNPLDLVQAVSDLLSRNVVVVLMDDEDSKVKAFSPRRPTILTGDSALPFDSRYMAPDEAALWLWRSESGTWHAIYEIGS